LCARDGDVGRIGRRGAQRAGEEWCGGSWLSAARGPARLRLKTHDSGLTDGVGGCFTTPSSASRRPFDCGTQVARVPMMMRLFESKPSITLTRQFGILSLVVVGLITTTFCLVISRSLKQDLLDREWSTTADFIRTEAIHNLKAADFAQPEGPGAQERFVTF